MLLDFLKDDDSRSSMEEQARALRNIAVPRSGFVNYRQQAKEPHVSEVEQDFEELVHDELQRIKQIFQDCFQRLHNCPIAKLMANAKFKPRMLRTVHTGRRVKLGGESSWAEI